ncbi:outer membrane protein [Bradyrhizobium sp. DASA03007]|uniref:outer membrane protein n=1 Tax=unclassified Bradyrhizobium TaxID=2631580 RepID=UPI003F6E6932
MRRLLLGVLLAGVSLPAVAADMAAKAQPGYVARNFDWTGFYVGANGGYGFTNTDGLDMKGGFVGGQLGYNLQSGMVVYGIEGDLHWADISQSVGVAGIASAEARIQAFGTVRGRIGVAFDQVLLYGTGGAAFANNKLTATLGAASVSDTQWHAGWTAGGGVEVAFNRNWSGKVEYLFNRFSSQDYFNGVISSGDVDLSTIKAGVNYRF